MVDILNWIIQQMANIVSALLAILPNSPFQWIVGSLQPYLGVINYFVPFSAMVAEMTVVLPAVLVWYGIRWILRIVRYSGG